MLNFEMFIESENSKSIKLSYRKDAPELLEKWAILALNEPEKYKFLLNGDWTCIKNQQEDNWNSNYLFVEKDGEPIGYICYTMKRPQQFPSENGLFILPEYWGYDVPMVALKKWADMMLLERNYHKLVLTSHPENTHLYSILEEASKVGLRKVGTFKNHVLLIDNNYYDQSIFELSREDYIKELKRIKEGSQE
jgi:RimJ/RimL family protein N-acetyltransferase